jgi:hypothetical protein
VSDLREQLEKLVTPVLDHSVVCDRMGAEHYRHGEPKCTCGATQRLLDAIWPEIEKLNASYGDVYLELEAERDRLRAQLEETEAALLMFGKHDEACDVQPGLPDMCNCGLRAALQAGTQEPEK